VERKGSEEEEEEGASMAVVSVLPFMCKRKGRPREMEEEEENNRNAKDILEGKGGSIYRRGRRGNLLRERERSSGFLHGCMQLKRNKMEQSRGN
jgi:hypothetical protein